MANLDFHLLLFGRHSLRKNENAESCERENH
jgi:hypothetical protein